MMSIDASGLSPDAARLAQYFIERSSHGMGGDPAVEFKDLIPALGISEDALLDATEELEGQDCAIFHEASSGFRAVAPGDLLFARYDRYFADHDAEHDAAMLSAHLLAQPDGSGSSPELAQAMGWGERRLNPAVQWLLSEGFVEDDPSLAWPWLRYHIRATRALRRRFSEKTQAGR